MFIDTHAHINFNAFKDDGDKVIKRALENNTWVINVGSQYSSSKRAVEYAEKYPEGVYAAVGLHPMHLENLRVDLLEEEGFESRKEDLDINRYRELAKNPKVIAIGEIGLDYYHPKEGTPGLPSSEDERKGKEEKELILKVRNNQKKVLVDQLKLTAEIKKPVIIHCREAHDDMTEILKKEKQDNPNLTGVLHCFSGNLEEAKRYIDLGFFISFTGLITFVNKWDEVIKNIDLDKIMVETDCPYLTPIPFRGQRNEPLYVKHVAEKIAEIKGTKIEEVAEQTTKNARKLFGI